MSKKQNLNFSSQGLEGDNHWETQVMRNNQVAAGSGDESWVVKEYDKSSQFTDGEPIIRTWPHGAQWRTDPMYCVYGLSSGKMVLVFKERDGKGEYYCTMFNDEVFQNLLEYKFCGFGIIVSGAGGVGKSKELNVVVTWMEP